MKNSIRLIRISFLSILLLALGIYVIVEYVDVHRSRNILFILLFITLSILAAILLKKPKCAIPKVMILDFVNIAIFIGLIVICGKNLLAISRIQNDFEGNNGFSFFYSKSIGDKGFDNIESALEDKIEIRKQTTNQDKLEEIYRIQIEDKTFIYFEESEGIVEFEFHKQDDLYYYSGSKVLMYDGIGSSDEYTMEETIKKDIANTMWRGINTDEVGVPAWGVCSDERIFSMTVNSKKADDIILIDEKDGKKYYFWIMTNIGEIKTIDDVKKMIIEIS